MALCLRVELTQKPCAVFGGGAQALRRTRQLLQEGARVTVYSPAFRAEFSDLPVECITAPYCPTYLQGVFFAAAATDSAQVNAQIVQDCTRRGIVVISSTRADTPFHPMANRPWEGGLVAVSVPSSPALAARLADVFAHQAQLHYARTARLLGKLRAKLQGHPQAAELLRQAAQQTDSEIEHLIKGDDNQ